MRPAVAALALIVALNFGAHAQTSLLGTDSPAPDFVGPLKKGPRDASCDLGLSVRRVAP